MRPPRLLVVTYALFALAAGARSAVQIATRFTEAPVAYALSGVAAAIYIAAALLLSHPSPRNLRLAAAACALELAGVVATGIATTTGAPFPDQTVWSDFGAGYGYVPLVLPMAGLAWLLRSTWIRPSR